MLGEEKVYGGKDLPKSQELSAECTMFVFTVIIAKL